MIIGRHHEAGLPRPQRLRRAAGVADDHRQPAGRGLQRRQPQALGVQPGQPGAHRQREHVGPLQLGDHTAPRQRPGEPYGPGQPDRCRSSLSSRPRSGPSPTRTSSGRSAPRGQRSRTSAQARSRWVKPFCGDEPADRHRPRPVMSFADSPDGAWRVSPELTKTRAEPVQVDRRREPEQPVPRRRAQRRRDPGWVNAETAVRWSQPSPIRRSRRRPPGTVGPPRLVAVGQPDDALRSRSPQRRRQQAERSRGPEDHPGGAVPTEQFGRAGGHPRCRQQQRAVPDHRIAAVAVGPLGARRTGRVDHHVVVEQRADVGDERLDAADPGREVVGDDQGPGHVRPLGRAATR